MTTRNAYPRPELVRQNWINLCGEWEFEFDFGKSGKPRGVARKEHLEKTIQVPFCPESELSGIGYKDFIPGCWYRKTVNVPHSDEERVILNFEAACHKTEVFVNGVSVGRHRGSYTPFSFDITSYMTEGDNSIAVYCESDVAGDGTQSSGKQCARYQSYGCYYTRSTGIYAPVWMEVVPAVYLKNVRMDPDVDNEKLDLELSFPEIGAKAVSVTAFLGGKEVGKTIAKTTLKTVKTSVSLSEISLWSIETPTLYDLEITVSDGKNTDTVRSYFGMRKIELDDRCLRINGKRVFMRLVLDQGYYKDSVYTAPTDDAFEKDIMLSKRLGFNGARLHERVFERRFLYDADRLGYIVWGEYANGNVMNDARGIGYFLPEWMETVRRDYSHPAIIGWCPENESYWVHDIHEICQTTYYHVTKQMDPYRPVIDASGGVHFISDMYDIHDYTQDPARLQEKLAPMIDDPNYVHNPIHQEQLKMNRFYGQPVWVSEYGGTYWNPDELGGWGYGNAPKSEAEFAERYAGLTKVLLDHPRICGFCYTQLTDIEQEQNGLYKYDRSRKFSDEVYDRIREANVQLSYFEQHPKEVE